MELETYREGNTFSTVVAIINDLKEKTDEFGFGVESLTYMMSLKDRFVEEDKLIEAVIVNTYMEANTEDPDSDRFEYDEKTKAIALELGLETADRYIQE